MDGFTKGGGKVRKAVVAGIAVAAVIAVVSILFVIQRTTSPVFQLIDNNWDVDYDFDEEFNPMHA
jgi:flagellar biosynthesis/type III secretory pathway M-ring protein FliF/YscJ